MLIWAEKVNIQQKKLLQQVGVLSKVLPKFLLEEVSFNLNIMAIETISVRGVKNFEVRKPEVYVQA